MKNWFLNYKIAAGDFKLSPITLSLIDYLVSITKKSYLYGFQQSEEILAKDLLFLSKYKPTRQSQFAMKIKYPGKPIHVYYAYEIVASDIPRPELSGAQSNNSVINNIVDIIVTLHLPYSIYHNLDRVTKSELNDIYSELFGESGVGLKRVLLHEFTHAVKDFLGYDNPEGYSNINEDHSRDEYLRYISHPIEFDPHFSMIVDMLKEAANGKPINEKELHSLILNLDEGYKSLNNRDKYQMFIRRLFNAINEIENNDLKDDAKNQFRVIVYNLKKIFPQVKSRPILP